MDKPEIESDLDSENPTEEIVEATLLSSPGAGEAEENPLTVSVANNRPGSDLPQKKKNTLGVISLVLAIVAILGVTPLAPFAVILSFFALRRPPRELAIGALIIGAFSTVVLFWGAIFMYVIVTSTSSLQKQGTDFWRTSQTRLSVQSEAYRLAQSWGKNEKLMTEAEGNKSLGSAVDGWDNAIYYESDGKSFSLRSHGADGKPDTLDDIVAGPFFSPDEVNEY